jgi:thiol-disulfide isomerase/thioredoxin
MRRGFLVLAVALVPALGLAQSLGELAKKERDRRQRNREAGVSVRIIEQATPAVAHSQPVPSPPEPAPIASPGPATVPKPAARRDVPSRSAPDFSLDDRYGRRVSLADFRGKPVLLDFWATWCGPCRESMPELESLHRKYLRRGLQVVGVNVEGRAPEVLAYVDQNRYSFQMVFEGGNMSGPVARSYGVRSIPRSFLIDARGDIVFDGHPLSLSEALIEETLTRP